VNKWIVCFFFFTSVLLAQEDQRKVSEALGRLIGKNLELLEVPLDLASLVKGIENEVTGTSSSLSLDECMEVVAAFQQEKLHEKSIRNEQEAIKFLKNNQNKEGVISLDEGNLQYEILKEGQGQRVQSYNSPLVCCQRRFLQGKPVQSGCEEEIIPLSEAILGLSHGIVGMREKEVRILYVHPKLGYESPDPLHPNELLIFEIEVIQADASSQDRTLADLDPLSLRIQ
jgi:peptidylprolyl isomerase